MKKAFNLFSASLSKVHWTFFTLAVLCAVAMMAGCKGGAANENNTDRITDTKSDTLWADGRGYWEIKTPYEENGRTVLYRSCVFAGQEDGSVNEIELSYYLLRRGTPAYDSSLNMDAIHQRKTLCGRNGFFGLGVRTKPYCSRQYATALVSRP